MSRKFTQILIKFEDEYEKAPVYSFLVDFPVDS